MSCERLFAARRPAAAGRVVLAATLLNLLPVCLSAAVSGAVINRSTGEPQAGALITLYQVGEGGMQPVKSVKSGGRGEFSIDHDPQGPHLLQTIHDGVVYNRMVQPGGPVSGLELDVFDSVRKGGSDLVSQHMVLLEPMGGILHVNESILLNNAGNTTRNDPEQGALRVYLPPQIQGEPRLMVTAPQGMPVSRDLRKTAEANVFTIDFPLKPGETRFDLTYVVRESEPRVFASRVLHEGSTVRLVAPSGVDLLGEGISQIGQEPQTQAKVYEVRGSEYSVTVQGTGSLSAPEEERPSGGGGGGIEQIQARIYDRLGAILGLTLLILAAGFLLLYRRTAAGAASGAPARKPAGPGKQGAR